MRIPELRTNAWQRLKRPTTWGALLGFGLLWLLSRWGVGLTTTHWQELLFPFVVPFAYLVLSPIPWQWTGDERPLAGIPRGAFQALGWNLLWFAGIVLLLGLGASREGLPTPDRRAVAPMAHPPPPWQPEAGPPRRSGPFPDFGAEPGDLPRSGPGAPPPREEAPMARIFHPREVVIILTNLSFAMLLGWVLANKERSELKEAEAVQAATLAKARALQSQMNPHVLFNAISGLTELVWRDQKATEDALVNLAQLLRDLLDSSTRPVDPLTAERALVEHYLAVEHIRLGSRLRVVWDWNTDLESILLPPLLLQPLVENAIKHGIAPSREGGDLRIFLQTEGSGFRLGVANTGLAYEPGRPEGIGLRNLRERLSLLGERPECLTLESRDSWTVAELHFGVTPEAAS